MSLSYNSLLALTEDDINEIEAEYNSAAPEQADQESYIQP